MKIVLTPADKLPVEVRKEEDAPDITAKDISVTMDLSKYQNEGNYTVELQVELPDGYALESVPSIKVNLEKIQACDRDGDRNNGGMTDGKSESNHKESYGPAFKTRREPL